LNTTNIDELRRKLRSEAEAKAENIVAKAEEEASKIIREAMERWEKRAEEERARIIREAEARAQIIVSEARRRARLIISEAKYNILNSVFEEAYDVIRSRKGFDAERSLNNLLDDALRYIDNPARIYINPIDRRVVEKILRSRGLTSIEIVESDRIIGGLVLESIDGKRVDNTYNTRLERARLLLTPMVKKELWG